MKINDGSIRADLVNKPLQAAGMSAEVTFFVLSGALSTCHQLFNVTIARLNNTSLGSFHAK